MNAFVTGGSRGIGRAIVLRLVQAGMGCAFTYVGNQEAAGETVRLAREGSSGAGPRVRSHRLDVTDAEAAERVVEEAIDELGRIDVLVNNAGIVANNAAALMTTEQWDRVVATNLSGPFYVTRSFLMHFVGNRFGRIINISSLAQEGASGQANYAAAKAGLIGLTKTLSREYGPKGITANVVTVGYVETGMTDEHMARKLHEAWLQYCPLRRIGTAEEIASLVHYLSTPEAGFISGEVIRVSGGLTYVP